jgi:hypothetical protein
MCQRRVRRQYAAGAAPDAGRAPPLRRSYRVTMTDLHRSAATAPRLRPRGVAPAAGMRAGVRLLLDYTPSLLIVS